MPTRTAGAVMASAIAGILLGASLAAPAEGARGDDTCFGEAPTIETSATDLVTQGTSGPDVILGGQRVEGLGGRDLICDARFVLGGPGNDRIRLTDGGTARGNGGDDEFISITIDTTAGGATMIGGPGDDVFWGGIGPDIVYGGTGDDTARTGGGNDVADLGVGDDLGYGGPGDDQFVAGRGNDYVDGGTEVDTVDGGPGRDRCLVVENRTSCKRAP